MSIEAADLLAGPIVRRVSTDRVSVWVALGVEVSSVRLMIRSRHSTDIVDDNVEDHTDHPGSRSEASVEPIRIGMNLRVALATVTFAARDLLLPSTVYAYDLDFVTEPNLHQNLGALGLMKDDKVGHPHGHVALGYEEGALPTFKDDEIAPDQPDGMS